MKKHFTGIALFIFIVGISAFVASLFVEIPKAEIFEIQTVVPRYEGKKKCSKMKTDYNRYSVSAKVAQAVYNEQTERLYMDYLIESEDTAIKTMWIDLHFFSKTADGTNFLTTEKISLKPDFRGGTDAFETMFSSFESINSLASHENLYVIAEPTMWTGKESSKGVYLKNIPEFDESKATAVLVAKD